MEPLGPGTLSSATTVPEVAMGDGDTKMKTWPQCAVAAAQHHRRETNICLQFPIVHLKGLESSPRHPTRCVCLQRVCAWKMKAL